jgi:hypothetical protein
MLRRYLGGLAAALGLTGAVFAQPAVPIQTKSFRPAYAQPKPTGIEQVKSDAPVAAPAVPLASMPAPAVAQPIAGGCPPAIAADVAAACGETGGCGTALDCLCGPAGRVWFGAEYLLWTGKGNGLPPLATRATGVSVANAPALPNTLGTLGAPGTATVIGGRDYNDDWRSGVRVYGGLWLDPGQRIGAEMDWFYLGESRSREVAGGTDGNGFVYRPFTNNVRRNADGTFTVVPAFQDTELVQYPGVLAGTVAVESNSNLWGLNPNGILNLACNPCGRLDFLVGYRYLNLTDDLYIREELRGLEGSPNPGSRFLVEDRFRTQNQFNGVNLGLAWERRMGAIFLNVRGAVALGNTNTVVEINGATTTTTGAVTRQAGGLLAQPSNIGRYELNKFAVVPEVGVRLGVQLTDHLRVYAGYNFLYWSNVIRTGDAIDLRVNASQLPPRTNVTGELFPRFTPRYTDYWVHGVVFGAQLRY